MQPIKRIQLLIAAKQFLFRLGIKTMLNVIGLDTELTEVDTYEDIKTFLDENDENFFLIINDDILPALNKDHYLEIIESQSFCKVLFICKEPPKEVGADNFVSDSINQVELIDKFQDFFFKPVKNEEPNNDKAYLSSREQEILKSVALGLSNKEIADKLFISINTVITHRKNITDKLDIKSIAGLTVYALINNLIKAEDVNV